MPVPSAMIPPPAWTVAFPVTVNVWLARLSQPLGATISVPNVCEVGGETTAPPFTVRSTVLGEDDPSVVFVPN